ncbi:hypothetical protein ACFXKH_33105 [Streptomyces caelestis]|uniref:hypothetical protein n=1 Tax=Streptomyces caelestis TaxID=36816 RepID=UPI0036B22710
MNTRNVMAALVLLAGAALAGTAPATATTATEAGPETAPRAAPSQVRAFASKVTGGLLSESRGILHTKGTDDWILFSPPGAPQGVYQLQVRGTTDCIEAFDPPLVGVEPCADNPGKSQRWKLNARIGSATTIESREYPGYFLTPVVQDGKVELVPEDDADIEDPRIWTVLRAR